MRTKGFTLIELLVVIAILAGLVAILFPNFMDARARARDTQRKSDLKNIQKALEIYRENQNPMTYPADGFFSTCDPWSDPNIVNITYMNKFPGDPLGNCATGKKKYYYHMYGPVEPLKYDLYACLENKADQEGTGVSPSNPYNFQSITGYSCSTDHYFKVTEP